MNVIDAAYAVVHDYPGGAEALAARIGMRPAVLRGKVNANDVGHHLTVAESLRIQSMTGDHRILQAEADELGYMLTPLAPIGDEDIAQAAMRSVREFGEFMAAAEDALKDGKVSPNELRRVERELLEHISQAARLHKLIAAKVRK